MEQKVKVKSTELTNFSLLCKVKTDLHIFDGYKPLSISVSVTKNMFRCFH